MSVRLSTVAVLFAASAGLAACGKAGALERPPPLFGRTAPAADAGAGQDAYDPSRPVRTVDPRRANTIDDATDPAPSRTVPIGGRNPSANDPAPQGALPDPYANPR